MLTVHKERGVTSANFLFPLFPRPCLLSALSQACSRAQASLVPPHEVWTLTSGHAALHGAVPVPRSAVWAEGEAEASCAVTYLKHAVWSQEGVSLASSPIVDRLQVIVNCTVVQLLPPLQSPPPPQEDNACHQNQHQNSQNAGDGEGGGGWLGGLAQSWLETGLKRELTTWTHEALRTLAYWSREVGKASATVLAWTGATGV